VGARVSARFHDAAEEFYFRRTLLEKANELAKESRPANITQSKVGGFLVGSESGAILSLNEGLNLLKSINSVSPSVFPNERIRPPTSN